MAEVRTGLRRILSNPKIYGFMQGLVGASDTKQRIINDYIRPTPNMVLLDVGCGPADILASLPEDIEYIGFDADPNYIQAAKDRYGNRGRFFQEHVSSTNIETLGTVDLVMAIGVLHHLDDDEVRHLSALAYQALHPGGRFLTIDPSFVSGQHWLARFLISKDRGQNVRQPQEYKALLQDIEGWSIKVDVRHDLLQVPYTHAIIECSK